MVRSTLLAALALLCAGSAFAQSTVSVYGRLNTTAERMRIGNQTVYRLNDNSSRIGFRGVEDLGGGLQCKLPDRARLRHRYRPPGQHGVLGP